jgi:hypothetical protein
MAVDHGLVDAETTMAMTAMERMRAVWARRRRRTLVLSVEVHGDDLREIARRGYEGPLSRKPSKEGERETSF